MTNQQQNTNTNPTTILEFARLQLAAEALYGFKNAKPEWTRDAGSNPNIGNISFNNLIKPDLLESGNGHNSKFTQTEAEEFAENWEMVAHIANTTTGFSGSLFRAKKDIEGTRIKAQDLVMSFRSTEFVDDDVHDGRSTNTLEIKEKGWAFGQIADMEHWFGILQEKGLIDKPLYVTGYSLGGHLATAFNILHRYRINKRTGDKLIKATYTFNGAGVGYGSDGKEITTENLQNAINEFNKFKEKGAASEFSGEICFHHIENGKVIKEKEVVFSLSDIYKKVKELLNFTPWEEGNSQAVMGTADDLSEYLKNIAKAESYIGDIEHKISELLAFSARGPLMRRNITRDGDKIDNLKLLKDAVIRVREIANENERIKTLTSGGGENQRPYQFPARYIDSLRLDYQVAVLLAAREYTKALSIAGGAVNIGMDIIDHQLRKADDTIDDFYNIWAATKPSMVAVSQLHYGKEDVLVDVEDQPLVRGHYIKFVMEETGKEAAELSELLDFQLLTPDYNNSAFGDTHSLVLIVDSLSVQKTINQLDSSFDNRLYRDIFKLASNQDSFIDSDTKIKKLDDNYNLVEGSPDAQGYSEGDVLENIINYIAKQFGISLELDKESDNKLKGDLNGGTWALIDDHESADENGNPVLYTGRGSLQSAVAKINKFIKDNHLEDAFTILPATEASAQAAAADFGHFLALKTLSPFVLAKKQGLFADKQAAVEKIWSDTWGKEYYNWQHDVEARQNQQQPTYYSDKWLQDRQALLRVKSILNISNLGYEKGLGSGEMSDKQLATLVPGFGSHWISSIYNIKKMKDKETGINYTSLMPAYTSLIERIIGDNKLARMLLGKDNVSIQFNSNKGGLLEGKSGIDHLYGGDGVDTLYGGDGNDHLEGGSGDDHLYGGKGQDYLYGGGGHDYYHFKSDEIEDDVIFDPDEGEIRIDDKPLKGVHVPPSDYGRWRDEDGYTYITLNERSDGKGGMIADLQIVTPQNKRLTWKDWHYQKNEKGLLGSKFKLALKADKQEKLDVHYMNGDVVAPFKSGTKTYDWKATSWNYATGKLNGGVEAKGFHDVLRGSAAKDVVHGLDGNDAIDGSDGNDILYGDDGHDLITGGKGSDRVFGGKGDDVILGTSHLFGYVKWVDTNSMGALPKDKAYTYQNGQVWGMSPKAGSSKERILYGANIDYVRDETNQEGDYLVGGDGADTVYGSHENDWIYGDEVSQPDYVPDEKTEQGDVLYGLGGDDYIFGGLGNDTLYGDGHINQKLFGYLPAGFHGNDTLYGGEGEDTLYGQLGSDRLYGGAEFDVLVGGTDIDLSEKEDDLDEGDYLYGGSGYDLLVGNAGNDYLYGEEDGGRLYGGRGNDFLFSGSHYRKLENGLLPNGQQVTYVTEVDNELYGGSGNDMLYAEGSSVMDGGADNDGYWFDEVALYAGAQHEILPDASGNDTVYFRSVGLNQIQVALESDNSLSLKYGQGVISIRNYYDIEQVVFAGNERVPMEALVEMALQQAAAMSGNHDPAEAQTAFRQTGSAGNDTLAAASETAYLHGGSGSDTYVIKQHFKQVTVSDFQASDGETDKLVFEQLNADDVLFHHVRNDLVISNKATGGKVTVAGYFDEQNPGFGVNEITFANGITLDKQSVRANLSGATEFADELTLAEEPGVLNGLGGDDRLWGSFGDDTLNGGSGNDVLQGGRGHNTYVFEGDFGRDVIRNPIVSTESRRDPREYDYQINRELFEQNQTIETLQFASLRAEDVSFHRRGNDLLVKQKDSSNQVLIERFFASSTFAAAYTFGFIEGQTIAGKDIPALLPKWNAVPQASGEFEVQQVAILDEWHYVLPVDRLFSDADQDVLTYQVSLANGKPLPDWLQFDAANHTLHGTASEIGQLNLLVTATDSLGASASLPLTLEMTPEDLTLPPKRVVEGDDGDNQLHGSQFRERLNGYDGDDDLYGGGGSDILDGGRGNDRLNGGLGADTYVFGRDFGKDKIITNWDSSERPDTIHFTDGIKQSDLDFKRVLDDLVISTKEGDNEVVVTNHFRNTGGYGIGQVGRVVFDDGTSLDVEQIKALSAIQKGTDQNDNLSAFDDVDHTLYGLAGNDYLYGNKGNDILDGGVGNDVLTGGDGDDTLIGGEGDDTLEGGLGRNTYIFGHNFGQDTIIINQDEDKDNAAHIIRFNEGWLQSDFDYLISGNDLVIAAKTSQDRITVRNFLNGNGNNGYQISNIVFSDGAQLDSAALRNLLLTGTEKDDRLFAFAEGSKLSGLDGNDVLTGSDQVDILDGGSGNDTLYGKGGDDMLIGGAGNDHLDGGEGSDFLDGGEGEDTYILGNGDTIQLSGRSGSDTVIINHPEQIKQATINLDADFSRLSFRRNDFSDEPAEGDYRGFDRNLKVGENSNWEYSSAISAMFGSVYSITFGSLGLPNWPFNMNIEDDPSVRDLSRQKFINYAMQDKWYYHFDGHRTFTVAKNKSLNDGFIIDAGFGNQLTLQNVLANPDAYQNIDFTFKDGVKTNLYGLMRRYLEQSATDGNDSIRGFITDDVIHGGSGNDLLQGGYGNDTLDGGAGNDLLVGGYYSLYWNRENRATLDEGFKNISASTDRSPVFDNGSDTYVFSGQFGHDVVIDYDLENSTNIDTLWFKDVSSVQDLVFRRSNGDLVISTADNTQSVSVRNHFLNHSNNSQIEQIKFGVDGKYVLDTSSLEFNKLLTMGTDGDDDISGTKQDDFIEGKAGNDQLAGYEGNDTYIFAKGWGQDTIMPDWSRGSSEIDVDKIKLIDIMPEEIAIRNEDGNMVLYRLNSDDKITVQQQFIYPNYWGSVDQVEFADGTIWNRETIWKQSMIGSSGDDNLRGEGQLFGGAGDDTLTLTPFINSFSVSPSLMDGGDGNDILDASQLRPHFGDNGIAAQLPMPGEPVHTLRGGKGDDTLYGSPENDVYLFDLGDGHDIIINRKRDQAYTNTAASYDIIRFGAGIAPKDLQLIRRDDDLILRHRNGSDSITVRDHYLNWIGVRPLFQINEIQFADGTVLDAQQIEQQAGRYGTEQNDQLIGEQGNDTIYAGSGDDQIFANNGDDVLYGEDGNDYLDGGAGQDKLYGGIGNDTLMGGAGNDILDGGAGDDNYLYQPGHGQDTIDQSGGGNDTLFFMNGIKRERLSFRKDGQDLLILVDQDQQQSVRVKDHFLGGDKALRFVQPDGGYRISAETIAQLIKAQELGGQYDSVVDGQGTADDKLYGSEGKDLIRGFGGNDQLFGFAGNDRLEGGAGNDYLSGGNGSGKGSGNDILLGGDGNDTLYGEDGDDLLIGGAGNDSYLYYAQQGADTIDNQGGGNDGLFMMNIAPNRLSFHRDGQDLVVLVDKDHNQQVRVKGHFNGGHQAISYIQPGSGYSIGKDQIAKKLTALPAGYDRHAASANALIQAMAAFGNSGGSGLNSAAHVPNQVNPLLATSAL